MVLCGVGKACCSLCALIFVGALLLLDYRWTGQGGLHNIRKLVLSRKTYKTFTRIESEISIILLFLGPKKLNGPDVSTLMTRYSRHPGGLHFFNLRNLITRTGNIILSASHRNHISSPLSISTASSNVSGDH